MPRDQYASSEYYQDDDDMRYSDYDEEADEIDSLGDSGDSYPASESGNRFIAQAERAMSRLKEIEAATDWKRALKHKSGVVSYLKKDAGAMGKKHPIFKGEGIIRGYSPQAVFAVVGTRKLWDEWYAEGNLVENLNETTSLTYMCMQGIVGSSTRDLSLVEKVEGTPDGTIYFCATSVDTPKVPKVSGRVRATIGLNGWALAPYRDDSGKPATKVTYVLQVNVKTFWPAAISIRYMARRPVCIARIDDYLQKNGAPPMAGVDPEQTHPGQGSTGRSSRSRRGSIVSNRLRRASSVAAESRDAAVNGSSARSVASEDRDPVANGAPSRSLSRKSSHASVNGAAAGGSTRSSKSNPRNRTPSVSAPPGAGLAALLAPAPADESSDAHKIVLDGVKQLKDILNDNRGWTNARDFALTKIHLKNGEGDLPITKTEATVSGVTTEQVLATIQSTAARRIWAHGAIETHTEETHGGFHDGIYTETVKGVYPYLQSRKFVVAKGVVRTDKSSDHGEIFNVARSINHNARTAVNGYISGEINVLGFQLVPDEDGVLIRHVSEISINNKTQVPAHVKKIMIANQATAPRAITQLINEHGHAPYFIRWGEGEAYLDSDHGDIVTGEMIYRVKPGDGGSSGSTPQKAWFQWSDKTYPDGIAFAIEPRDAITVAQVAGMDRTIEFAFVKVPSKGAIIRAQRGNGRSPDDVRVNGKAVIDTVEGARTAGGSRASRKAASSAAAGAAAAGGARSPEKKNSAPLTNGVTEEKKTSSSGVNGIIPSGSTVRETVAPVQQAVAAAVGPKVTTKSGEFPPNTMIIITKDLYFNSTQVLVIFLMLGAAFVYGRLF